MGFNWNKEEFGDLSNKVEALVEQAMKFSKKETATELETKFAEQLSKVESDKQSLSEKLLEMELSSVEPENLPLVKDLVSNLGINEAKAKYSHLFQNKVANVESLIEQTTNKINEREQEVLDKYARNEVLSQSEQIIFTAAMSKQQ